jgi:hypothetical protein
MEAGPLLPPTPPARPTHVRWIVFVLACAVSWLLYLHRYSWGVIKPTIQQENPQLTDTEMGGSTPLFRPPTPSARFPAAWSATSLVHDSF